MTRRCSLAVEISSGSVLLQFHYLEVQPYELQADVSCGAIGQGLLSRFILVFAPGARKKCF